MSKFLGVVMGLIVGSNCALAEHFNVAELPIGADVTLPGAAYALVPMSTAVKVSSTDLPQTIRVVPVAISGADVSPVQLSIFDAQQERVRYVKVAPGAPFLYSFRGLSTITLRSTAVRGAPRPKDSVFLKIESDKPITVAR